MLDLRRFTLGNSYPHEGQLISHIPNTENNRDFGAGLGLMFRGIGSIQIQRNHVKEDLSGS